MGVIATFSFPAFVAQYPEFSGVSGSVAQGWWNQAGLYNANDGSGPVQDMPTQQMLMNMLTAHVGCLAGFLNADGQPNPTIVGRIVDATQGSVTVHTEMDRNTKPESSAWFYQTQYGATWFQATRLYRSARYLPGYNQRIGAGFGPGRFGGLGNFR